MKTVFRLIRWPLGQIVILIDWLTRPKIPLLPPEQQEELDAITSSMKIYHFKQCPFCVKTRRNIRRLGLNIETRDARNDPQWNSELINEGGKIQLFIPPELAYGGRGPMAHRTLIFDHHQACLQNHHQKCR